MSKTATKDLTKGSPLIQILLFSIPFLIGNLFQQFYNIADMVIVGRTLDPLAYAAVGSTGSLSWFASGSINALSIGFSVITAQAFGAGEEENIKKSFAISIKLMAILSVLLATVCAVFARPILELLKTPENLIDQAYDYIVWIFAGLVATALYNLLSNMIRTLGDSKSPLYFLIIACVINIILDYVLIKFCGLGTAGAGIATVIAQLISGLLCIVYIVKKHPLLHISARHFKPDPRMAKSLLKVAIPMMFVNMVLSFGGIAIQFVTNGFGDLYVSARVTGAKIENFVTAPLLSFGSAVSVFSAQNYGARKFDRMIEGGKQTLLMSFAWIVFAALLLLPIGKPLIRLIAGKVEQAVVDNAYIFILLETATTFILAPLVVFKAVLQGAGRTSWTMLSSFSELIGRTGVSLLVLFLTTSAILSEASAFILLCLTGPVAWLFGLLTILPDYISMRKGFNRKIAEQKAQLAQNEITEPEDC